MRGINSVTLLGRLGRDPERKGKTIRLRVATNRYNGDTDWHSVVVINEGLQASVERMTGKGLRVAVQGSIQYSEWEGKWYTTIVADRITFIDSLPSVERNDTAPAASEDTGAEVPF